MESHAGELVDTHAHLNSDRYRGDLSQVLGRAAAAGVGRMVVVGFDLDSSKQAHELARRHSGIAAAVGIHPHDAEKADLAALREIERLASRPEMVAVGETGLDFYRDLSPRAEQERVFRVHLSLASRLRKPVIIHDRDAHADVLRVVRSEGLGPAGGVMHCFSGDWRLAEECLALGFYISIAGPVTFDSARPLHEVARRVPLNRLLVETDCPYLTPHPFRGQRNEPAHVRLVAEKVAQLKEMPLKELARATTANAVALFGLKGPVLLDSPSPDR